MNKFAIALLALPMAAFSGAALAGDAAAGEAKAEICLDCHLPEDDFAGVDAAEIEKLIKAALAGEVEHGPEINELAEEDVADVAAYFAAEGAK